MDTVFGDGIRICICRHVAARAVYMCICKQFRISSNLTSEEDDVSECFKIVFCTIQSSNNYLKKKYDIGA